MIIYDNINHLILIVFLAVSSFDIFAGISIIVLGIGLLSVHWWVEFISVFFIAHIWIFLQRAYLVRDFKGIHIQEQVVQQFMCGVHTLLNMEERIAFILDVVNA